MTEIKELVQSDISSINQPLTEERVRALVEETLSNYGGLMRVKSGNLQSGNYVVGNYGWSLNSNGDINTSGIITSSRLTLENFFNDDNSLITYTGTWTQQSVAMLLGGTRTITTTVGDYFTIEFKGTSIGLFAERAGNLGKVEIAIDGEVIETVDLYTNVLYDRDIIFQITTLESKAHTLVGTIKNKNASSGAEGMGLQGYTLFPHPGIKLEQLSCLLYVYQVSLLTNADGYVKSAVACPTGYSGFEIVGIRPAEAVMNSAATNVPKLCWRTTEIYLYNGAADTTYNIGITLMISKL